MNAIIIEDESLLAKQLKEHIEEVAPEVSILEILPSIKTAVKWLMHHAEPDIIFADIQLSDGVSFEIFERYKLNSPVIFITAYDEYAIRAFKVNGIDYLLKPVDLEELRAAIDKTIELKKQKKPAFQDMSQLLEMIQHPMANKQKYREKFIVKQCNSWLPVYVEDIAYFYKDQLNYLFTLSGEKYIIDYTALDELEEVIDPKSFFRANRQYIIATKAISRFKLIENQKISITLKAPFEKEEIDISRDKAPAFRKWFEG